MKLSDYVIEFIKNNGVNIIFGYQGGAITHLVDSISKIDGIEFMSLYHEQAAAFAAEGFSRISGNIGVAIATSGPGATNLITGIGSSFFDSIPCLYITGQVNTYEYKRNNLIRQEGFQETDIVSIVKPITKYAIMITSENEIRFCLEKALYIAKEGRPGPVIVDIPMNIQRADIEPENLMSFYDSEEYKNMNKKYSNDSDVSEVIKLIKDAKRPVILAGGGVRLAKATVELKTFSELTGIPVATTLMGIDSFEHHHPNFIGYMGSYGTRYANLAVANSDLIIVIGSRLTSRQTSSNVKTFAREAKIVHIDIDINELNLKLKEDISVVCDIKFFLKKIIKILIEDNYKNNFLNWIKRINSYKEQYPSYPTQKQNNNIDPNEFMYKLSEMCDEDTIFCLDIGQNQIWASQSIVLKTGQRILNAGGMGPMGFALPSAIGAYKANPKVRIVAIVGDGGLQMNIQELQTIVRENIPVKIIVMNNHALGMIRHFQELYFSSNYYGTIEGYSSPDFTKVANAYGIDAINIKDENHLGSLIEILKNDSPYLVVINLSNITYVIPKLEMGRPIEDQSPLVNRDDLENNMIVDMYKLDKN